jgi:hypothetical protein
MENTSFEDFLQSIKSTKMDLNDFMILGNATSIWKDNDGNFFKLNFNRGLLLYALIGYLKPKSILEFGTGGGYSTLCMAKALFDFKIDGKIYTIDRNRNDEKIFRIFQLPDDEHVQEKKISNNEIWNSIAPHEWIEKIIPITGYSGSVMKTQNFNNIDFCYIDGVHTYDGTKHDFLSFLKVASNSFSVLFDDYVDRDFYGVKEFIDKEVDTHFNLKLIKTDVNNDLKKLIKFEHEYGMIYFNHISKIPAIKNYNKDDVDTFLKKYRNLDNNIRTRRYNLEKKIPFLKYIKFKFWK